MRILIADDHPLFRLAVKQVLSAEFPAAHFEEAGNAAEALHLANAGPWSVLILDLHLPGRSGLEVLGDLRKSHPKLPVLIVSGQPEEQFALRALKAGAAGYVTKESSPAELAKAVHQAVSGRRYVSPSVAERLASALVNDPDKPAHEALSDREFLVLRLMATGKSTKEIADELSLSIKTISTYRTRMLGKMRMKSNAELIRYAVENGLTN